LGFNVLLIRRPMSAPRRVLGSKQRSGQSVLLTGQRALLLPGD